MDYAREINSLAGETLAIQRFLIELSRRLSVADPRLDLQVRQAFDAAARTIEDVAIVAGNKAPPEHLTHALQVIEDMRAAALGNPDKLKDRV